MRALGRGPTVVSVEHEPNRKLTRREIVHKAEESGSSPTHAESPDLVEPDLPLQVLAGEPICDGLIGLEMLSLVQGQRP